MASLELYCLTLAPSVRNCATLDMLANFLVILFHLLFCNMDARVMVMTMVIRMINNNNSCLLRLLGLLSSSNGEHYYGPEGFKISNKSFKSE